MEVTFILWRNVDMYAVAAGRQNASSNIQKQVGRLQGTLFVSLSDTWDAFPHWIRSYSGITMSSEKRPWSKCVRNRFVVEEYSVQRNKPFMNFYFSIHKFILYYIAGQWRNMSVKASQCTDNLTCPSWHKGKHESSTLLLIYTGNQPVAGCLFPQGASNAECVSIWWCPHGVKRSIVLCRGYLVIQFNERNKWWSCK